MEQEDSAELRNLKAFRYMNEMQAKAAFIADVSQRRRFIGDAELEAELIREICDINKHEMFLQQCRSSSWRNMFSWDACSQIMNQFQDCRKRRDNYLRQTKNINSVIQAIKSSSVVIGSNHYFDMVYFSVCMEQIKDLAIIDTFTIEDALCQLLQGAICDCIGQSGQWQSSLECNSQCSPVISVNIVLKDKPKNDSDSLSIEVINSLRGYTNSEILAHPSEFIGPKLLNFLAQKNQELIISTRVAGSDHFLVSTLRAKTEADADIVATFSIKKTNVKVVENSSTSVSMPWNLVHSTLNTQCANISNLLRTNSLLLPYITFKFNLQNKNEEIKNIATINANKELTVDLAMKNAFMYQDMASSTVIQKDYRIDFYLMKNCSTLQNSLFQVMYFQDNSCQVNSNQLVSIIKSCDLEKNFGIIWTGSHIKTSFGVGVPFSFSTRLYNFSFIVNITTNKSKKSKSNCATICRLSRFSEDIENFSKTITSNLKSLVTLLKNRDPLSFLAPKLVKAYDLLPHISRCMTMIINRSTNKYFKDECYKELQIDSNENLVQPKLEELISNQILDFSEVVSFAVNNNIENST